MLTQFAGSLESSRDQRLKMYVAFLLATPPNSTSPDETTQTKDKHMSKLISIGEDETVLPDYDHVAECHKYSLKGLALTDNRSW